MEARQEQEPSLDLSCRLVDSVLEQLEATSYFWNDLCNFTGFICSLLFFSFLHTYLILHITYSNITETGLVIAAAAVRTSTAVENKTADKKRKKKIMILNLWWICGRIPPNVSYPS